MWGSVLSCFDTSFYIQKVPTFLRHYGDTVATITYAFGPWILKIGHLISCRIPSSQPRYSMDPPPNPDIALGTLLIGGLVAAA